MSSLDHLIDQENRPAVGGGLRRLKGGEQAEPRQAAPRAVLGEVNPNLRRLHHNNRTHGNKPQGTFSIFCDESVPAKPFSSSVPISQNSSEDKENIQPKLKGRDAVKSEVEGLRLQQSKALQLLHNVPEPMNTSAVEVESPMVVEEVAREQWRVPPIKDNHTVDIFTEPEYFQDIYMYLKESEMKHLPKPNYMAKQNDITHSMRSILVDWLVEVGEEYKLQTETLHLAVSYIDRFLSYMAVQRSKLQLVGTACMFIAAKYEEIYPPDVSEFVYITDDTYNKRQVLRMEHLVLKVLGFDLSVPTIHIFISKMVEIGSGLDENLKNRVRCLALYLAELSMVDGDFLKYPPSQIAGGCVAMARHSLELPGWTSVLEERTGYSVDELQPVLVELHATFTKAEDAPQQAVREKYKQAKHYGVSEITPPAL